MDQRIIDLYDEYTHKPLKRSEFINRLVRLTGSSSAAIALLPALELNYSRASTISEADEDIISEEISYLAGKNLMKAYFSRPSRKGLFGSVLVIHENRGLNPHIKDITRRLAKEGFSALAPDALSAQGGTPSDADKAREMFASLNAKENLENFLAGLNFLRSHANSNRKLGAVGFCWGGALAGQLAVHSPELNAISAFYGRQPAADEVKKIRARLQLHYGEQDERVNSGIPAFENALKKEGKKYELYIYPGTQHAFHNDTAPTRYNEEAAKLAWARTIKLFNEELR